MKRRKALQLISWIVGGAVLIPTALYTLSPNQKKYAAKIIYTQLHYLQLDAAGVTAFVNDYFNAPPRFMENVKWKSFYYLNAGVRQSDSLFQMVRAYLLSSDFFANKADKTKTVKYLGMFSPYKSPVANPYSYIHKYKL